MTPYAFKAIVTTTHGEEIEVSGFVQGNTLGIAKMSATRHIWGKYSVKYLKYIEFRWVTDELFGLKEERAM